MPELILTNARIHTLNAAQPTAQSIAIRDNRILALGAADALRSLLPEADVIDLHDRCVIPGLIDAHLHAEWTALGLKNVDAEAPTLDELLRRVEERVKITPQGAWIRGHGWNQNAWSGVFPSKADLDRVAPEHPVYLTAKSGHAAWANSIALKLAGVTSNTLNPPNGEIVREVEGEPTGIFFEDAMELVNQFVPEPTAQELAGALRDALPLFQRVGLTGVHDFDGARALQAWQILKENGELNLRVSKTIPIALQEHAIALGIRSGFGDDWLRLNSVKSFADGALGPQTALMIDPYEGTTTNRGISTLDKEEMFENVRRASAAGLSSTIHAIGDKANHDVLDVFALVRAEEKLRGGSRLRHRIEHVQLLHPDDFKRLAQLNVIASMQPIHATSDMLMADKFWGTRSRGAYAWRTQLDAGARLAFGSDSPVESFNPFLGIHAAVTRRRADGSPHPDGWYPEQRLTVEEAVHGFTLGAAYASYEETRKGSLAPGKLADLIVLDRDIFSIDPMEIAETQVVATVIDGQLVAGGW
ncbi:MAG TPA: amidohydrolase [Anaerolineae bacterium]|nr:amidohydrolase [Anaerolineae bacterium]